MQCTMFVAGPSTKTTPSALTHGDTGTCRLTYRRAQPAYISAATQYNPLSLKYLEQHHRYARSRSARQFEISELTPSPTHCTIVIHLSPNNDGLINFLCETRCDEEQLEPTLGSARLYIGGSFKDETMSVGPTLYSW